MKVIALQAIGVAIALALWIVGVSRDVAVARELRGINTVGAALPSPIHDVVVADTVPDIVTRIMDRNVFKSGEPSTTSTLNQMVVSPAVPVLTRPILSLRGIVGGPPWSAIVEGVPGRDGAVVMRLSDTLSGLRIAMIRRDTVVVRSRDTTWTLSLPRR